MDTPKLVFYEHNFDDSIIKSLSKNVLNLGNECRALAEENQRLKHEAVHAVNQIGGLQEENARLKAEVERFNDLIISGGAVIPDASVYP